MAADLAAKPYVKAPVMVDPAFNWSGFYIGGNVGYSWGRERDDGTLTGTQSAQVFRTAGPIPVGGPVVTPLAAQTILGTLKRQWRPWRRPARLQLAAEQLAVGS
jgi:outer membrane immunogenic protein